MKTDNTRTQNNAKPIFTLVVGMLLMAILLTIGFALETTTQAGHHFCLIMAGVFLGIGIGHYEAKH